MKNALLFAGIILLSFSSCKKNHFKKSEFLEDFYKKKIDPDLAIASGWISELGVEWNQHMWGGPSLTSLNEVQENFKLCLTEFERITFHNLGDISAINVYNAAYKTSIDTTEIWNNYAANSTFTSDLVNSYGNQEKGVFTLEYLLFSNHAVDSLLVTKYQSFVTAHIELLGENFLLIRSSWTTYKENFMSNDDEGVEGSYNIIINRIVHLLEDIIDKRINKPLDAVDEKLAVGYWSGTAWNNIKTLVLQLNDVYMGNAVASFNSIYNNVRKKNKKLAEDIKLKFETVIELGNSMLYDMNYYITTGSAELINYKEKLKEILVLFKLDVVQELDIVLTFGDNDGD